MGLEPFNLIGDFDISISGSMLIHSGSCVVGLQCWWSSVALVKLLSSSLIVFKFNFNFLLLHGVDGSNSGVIVFHKTR